MRRNPTLCAECAYKFWTRSKDVADSSKARLDGAVYSKLSLMQCYSGRPLTKTEAGVWVCRQCRREPVNCECFPI